MRRSSHHHVDVMTTVVFKFLLNHVEKMIVSFPGMVLEEENGMQDMTTVTITITTLMKVMMVKISWLPDF